MPLRIIDYGHEFHISWEFDHWHKRNLAAVKDLHVLDIYQQKQPVAKYIVTEKRKYWKAPAHDQVRKQVEQLKYSHHAEIVLPAELRPEMTGEVEPLPDLNIDLPITAELRPYQKNGIAGMMKFRKCMNGDEQGLGKTIQSLSAAIGIGEFPGMVIAPAATIYNWQNEWHKFSHKRALVLDPQKLSDTQRKNWFKYIQTGEYDVAVVSYQSFVSFCVESFPQGKGKNGKKKRWTAKDVVLKPFMEMFKFGILDESHRCKDPNTNQSKFILRFFVTLQNRFLLTGTPVVNKPKDIWPQLAIMGTLNSVFGGKKAFLDRYCEGGNGANNLKELNYMLNKNCFFRREKKDVAKDLPEKMRQTIVCDITTRADYHKAEKDMETWLESVGFDGQQISKKMQAEALIRLGVLRQISARGKLKEVAEFVEEVMDAGEKLVVFCNLYEIVDSLRHEFPKAVTVTGRDSSSQKQSNIEKFQKDPDCQLIICNIKAAGVGITLTASSRVAFVEYPWTYADCVQCEDRCIAAGQLIMTKEGFKKIEDVAIGDLVYSASGFWRKVTDRWSKSERQKCFVDIKYMGYDQPLTCTEDHRVYAYDIMEGEYKWIQAADLKPNRHMLVFANPYPDVNNLPETDIKLDFPFGNEFKHRSGTSMNNGRVKNPDATIELTEDLMYALGWYLAEGWSCVAKVREKGSFVAICGNSKDEIEEVKRIAAVIKSSFGLNDSKVTYYASKKNCFSAYVYSKNLAHNFIKWFGSSANNKQIPEFVFRCEHDLIRSFLNGYYAGDGYQRKNTQQATTASDKIAIGLCQLESLLGNAITLRKSTRGHWSFEYSIKKKVIRPSLIRNQNNTTLFPISEVSIYKPSRGKERVYDLTVEHDESFTVGLAAVHNCHRIGQVNNVMCTYFNGKDTVDEKLYNIIQEKRHIGNTITGASDQMEFEVVNKMLNLFSGMKKEVTEEEFQNIKD
jgi:SWI/SNF-related matrix-associated actin-dependent regulator of chromatin subfamily A-like protein 1